MNAIVRRHLPLVAAIALVALGAVVIVVVTLMPRVVSPTTPTSPVAAPTATGNSEMPPPTAEPTTPHLGTASAPLVTAPLPASAHAKGALVPGFPSAIISLPAGADIVSSSIATEGTRMQSTVVAEVDASEADIRSHFQGIFEPRGLIAAPTPSATGATATTYASGTDRITVTTVDESGRIRISIFALFTAGTN